MEHGRHGSATRRVKACPWGHWITVTWAHVLEGTYVLVPMSPCSPRGVPGLGIEKAKHEKRR